jgi:hypothetical protein
LKKSQLNEIMTGDASKNIIGADKEGEENFIKDSRC